MENLAAIYPKSFFSRRYKLNWRAVPLCHAIAKYFFEHPVYPLAEKNRPYLSILDVGCATGDLVGTFNAMGYRAKGIEGSPNAEGFLDCRQQDVLFADISDMMLDLRSIEKPRLLTCFEVAEHIDEPCAEQFIFNICSLCDRILMSIAPPGQGGHHHVNCREIAYWDGMFGRLGFFRQQEPVDVLRKELFRFSTKPGIKAIYQNLVYYEYAHPKYYIDADKRPKLYGDL